MLQQSNYNDAIEMFIGCVCKISNSTTSIIKLATEVYQHHDQQERKFFLSIILYWYIFWIKKNCWSTSNYVEKCLTFQRNVMETRKNVLNHLWKEFHLLVKHQHSNVWWYISNHHNFCKFKCGFDSLTTATARISRGEKSQNNIQCALHTLRDKRATE